MDIDVIYNEDCLVGMKKIPDKSIDLILTDPPYGTTACKWDSIIPFETMWTELKRIRKDDAAIVLFGSEPFSSNLRMSNIKEFKYDWIWEKGRFANQMLAKKQPLKIHEIVSVFYKKQSLYNPQGLIEVNKETRQGAKITDNLGGGIRNTKYTQTHTNYPKSIQSFKSAGSTVHPTQKPVELLEYLIKTYSNEGDIVLDFAMGSGSTAVAAVNTKRHYIGFELDEKYFDIACQRLDEVESSLL